MVERPILFSAPMVRAILAGRKSQTRRIIKPQPVDNDGEDITINGHRGSADYLMREIAPRFWVRWVVGDVLWVRETWTHIGVGVWSISDARMVGRGGVRYKADGAIESAGYWPSIHMPREFSRITLKVTGVKVERLQDISREDCDAEGIDHEAWDMCIGYRDYTEDDCWFYTWPGAFLDDGRRFVDIDDPNPIERRSYQSLWNSINGPGSWDANPWVVVISFARIETTEAPTG